MQTDKQDMETLYQTLNRQAKLLLLNQQINILGMEILVL
jgi:hypothetical protein